MTNPPHQSRFKQNLRTEGATGTGGTFDSSFHPFRSSSVKAWILILFPFVIMLWVWLSSLSFVPVPWPDDSAFYFVAKEFFKWPPRWVMLPQAPFEPTYRIYNFNTMPLYPILIGLIRELGIDGSFAIKILPLSAWAATGSLLSFTLYRNGLSFSLALLSGFALMMDPISRWASVIVRPESLIALCGLAIVLGLTFGFPKRLEPRKFWHPVSFLLATAAYAHFNAIHLLFPVVLFYACRPREMIRVGLLTALYLTPWILTVLAKPGLFIHQMTLQWKRLAIPNDWLSSPSRALDSLFNDMGSPEPWPKTIQLGMYIFGGLLILALSWGLGCALLEKYREWRAPGTPNDPSSPRSLLSVAPAGAWVAGSLWLWHSKPEVWFTTYAHLSLWTFCGIALLKLTRQMVQNPRAKYLRAAFLIPILLCVGSFTATNWVQARHLSSRASWNWDTYGSFIDCIDQELTRQEAALGYPKPFRVWDPTFPDITIELSRRHPDWELTRTNDFMERSHLAVKHGHEVHAVVVPETINWNEATISAPAEKHPEIRSVWMTWDGYFLKQLWDEAGWKPNRYLCQRGRWQAFIFMNPVANQNVAANPPKD